MAHLVGIDIGTSSAKAIVIDATGRVLGSASSAYRVETPRPGWSEQHPDVWWRGACEAIRASLDAAGVDGASVAAVGLSGQMHGSVLLDDADRPVRPALLWNDQRTSAECDEIEAAFGGRAALVRETGNAALTGFTAPKLLWVRRHEPDAWSRVRTLLLPKDWIGLRLTGERATDVGDASGTLLFRVADRRWSDEACRRLNLDRSLLPRAVESAQVVGRVMASASKATGVRAGTPVIAGSGDNMTSAVGAGVVEAGTVAVALGTSGVIIAPARAPSVDAGAGGGGEAGRTHLMCAADGSAAGLGSWCVTGCMLSAAGSLDWLRRELFPEADFETLMREAQSTPPGAAGLVFLPHLTGERAPYPNPAARGGWVGLTVRHTRGHLVRALVEGVSMTMARIADIMRQQGVPIQRARIGGGGARSALWRSIVADCLNVPVATTNTEEGPAFGAALLAGVGAGVWAGVGEACGACVGETGETQPDPARARLYEDLGRAQASIYRGVCDQFGALGAADL